MSVGDEDRSEASTFALPDRQTGLDHAAGLISGAWEEFDHAREDQALAAERQRRLLSEPLPAGPGDARAASPYDDAAQVCMAGTRLLVETEEEVLDGFLERCDAELACHVMGGPASAETTLTPLIDPEHLERVDGFVRPPVAKGHALLRCGKRANGLFHELTLSRPRSNDAEIVQREVFGPVLTLQTFAGEAKAVALPNTTEYGQTALIFTSATGRADRADRVGRAGVVWANTFLVRGLTAPFGGLGISGLGREGGDDALDFHSDLKTLQILDGSVR